VLVLHKVSLHKFESNYVGINGAVAAFVSKVALPL
jgi:hypothetical protein